MCVWFLLEGLCVCVCAGVAGRTAADAAVCSQSGESVFIVVCCGKEGGGQSDRRVSWRRLKVRCRVLQLKTDPAFSALKGESYLRAA